MTFAWCRHHATNADRRGMLRAGDSADVLEATAVTVPSRQFQLAG